MPRKTSEARLAPVPDPAPRRLLITSPKGGVGKTGLSSNLSVAAALEGLRVAALDFDRQRSFARWWQRRPEGTAPIDLVEGDLRDLTGIEQIGWGCDLLVIDTPTAVEEHPESMKRLILLADFILVPCQPSPDDTDSVAEWMRYIGSNTDRYAAVLNRVNRRARSFQDARRHLLEAGRLAPMDLPHYEDIIATRALGVGIMEVRGGKGAEDLRGVWNYVRREMAL